MESIQRSYTIIKNKSKPPLLTQQGGSGRINLPALVDKVEIEITPKRNYSSKPILTDDSKELHSPQGKHSSVITFTPTPYSGE